MIYKITFYIGRQGIIVYTKSDRDLYEVNMYKELDLRYKVSGVLITRIQ